MVIGRKQGRKQGMKGGGWMFVMRWLGARVLITWILEFLIWELA